jgi:hypothetical protein
MMIIFAPVRTFGGLVFTQQLIEACRTVSNTLWQCEDRASLFEKSKNLTIIRFISATHRPTLM